MSSRTPEGPFDVSPDCCRPVAVSWGLFGSTREGEADPPGAESDWTGGFESEVGGSVCALHWTANPKQATTRLTFDSRFFLMMRRVLDLVFDLCPTGLLEPTHVVPPRQMTHELILG